MEVDSLKLRQREVKGLRTKSTSLPDIQPQVQAVAFCLAHRRHIDGFTHLCQVLNKAVGVNS